MSIELGIHTGPQDQSMSDLRRIWRQQSRSSSAGVPLINDNPEAREQGMPVFIHPKASRGLMIELVEAITPTRN